MKNNYQENITPYKSSLLQGAVGGGFASLPSFPTGIMENRGITFLSFPKTVTGNLPFEKEKKDAKSPNVASCRAGNENAGRTGFTLIELLVVVLIIGILAAVALPQYEKAVAKARMTQLVSILKPLKDACETYYLANGSYPQYWGDLDVAAPAGCTVDAEGTQGYIRCTDFYIDLYDNSNKNLAGYLTGTPKRGYAVWLENTPFPNRRECLVSPGDSVYDAVCLGLGGVASAQTAASGCAGCTVYKLP